MCQPVMAAILLTAGLLSALASGANASHRLTRELVIQPPLVKSLLLY